ncbi:hypothetical protein [Cryptosporangium arvum]|uniref:Uncharacterized protein n=1 Tax=Cryptosporangium arvum DSM 44712 TaxID=927661 RepID=A0A010ZRH2_9ACTN|nr:hypothetical protein [Cryptosporangium arvum]EXG79782.1 hypothetical protein CryarDRAFT_0828 [Cryptosporangium arvum DSM 44712]
MNPDFVASTNMLPYDPALLWKAAIVLVVFFGVARLIYKKEPRKGLGYSITVGAAAAGLVAFLLLPQ